MDSTALDTTSLVSQGVAVTLIATLSNQLGGILLDMLPFCYAAIPLILLDLYYGRKKAKYLYDNKLSDIPCTIQRSIKMTVQKVFNYISWIFLSVTLALAFNIHSLIYVIMAIIYGLEVLSLLNTYGESKGVDIDEIGMLKLVCKFIWSRITGNFDEDFNEVIKKNIPKEGKKRANT